MNNRKNQHLENKDLEDVESRISELEDEMQLFKNLMDKGSNNETTNKRLTLAVVGITIASDSNKLNTVIHL